MVKVVRTVFILRSIYYYFVAIHFSYILGRWPWHLAIYHSEGVYLNYICGGSIISKEYVVTAAHCVTRPRTKEPTNLNGLLLYLGI